MSEERGPDIVEAMFRKYWLDDRGRTLLDQDTMTARESFYDGVAFAARFIIDEAKRLDEEEAKKQEAKDEQD